MIIRTYIFRKIKKVAAKANEDATIAIDGGSDIDILKYNYIFIYLSIYTNL